MNHAMAASPATLAYMGCSAADVCAQLAHYPADTRVLHAIDALVTAMVYRRNDTVEVLMALGTPMHRRGLFRVAADEIRMQCTDGGGFMQGCMTERNLEGCLMRRKGITQSARNSFCAFG